MKEKTLQAIEAMTPKNTSPMILAITCRNLAREVRRLQAFEQPTFTGAPVIEITGSTTLDMDLIG